MSEEKRYDPESMPIDEYPLNELMVMIELHAAMDGFGWQIISELERRLNALTTRAEEAEALLRRVNDEYKFYGDLLNETKENIKQHLTKTEAGNEV